MTHFPILARGLPVGPLCAAVDRHAELWNQHRLRAEDVGSPHGGMSDIWLRYNDWANFTGDRLAFNSEHEAVWYPAAAVLPEAVALCDLVMERVAGERLGGVLITRIPPGSSIALHTDEGWHVETYTKFYVQLLSAPGADFICGDERFNPVAGDLYQFDNRKPHAVENLGDGDRMTLIVCIKTAKGHEWN